MAAIEILRRQSRNLMVLGAALLAAAGLSACDDGTAPKTSLTIGLVTNNPNGMQNVEGFRESMAALESVDGRTISFIGPDNPVRGGELDRALQEFVERRVDLIFTAGTPTGVAAHRITKASGIPVVFGVIADPVRAGVMADLDRPGGNMTGVMLSKNQARRLELFLQIVPETRTVAVLYNPNDPAPAGAVEQLTAVASFLNITVKTYRCPDNSGVSAALAAISPEVDAVFLLPDSVVNKRIKDIIDYSLERKIPVSGPSTLQVHQGALMTYGFVHREAGAQAAKIAEQILKGVKPGDIPVQEAESYLGFNLESAARIDLTVPAQFIESASLVVRP